MKHRNNGKHHEFEVILRAMECMICHDIKSVPVGSDNPIDYLCSDCGVVLVEVKPPPSIDDVKPIPGVLSALFDRWRKKRVRIKKTKQVGIVVGVNPRPRFPKGLPTVESGYLTIALDRQDRAGSVVENALPEDVELLG